jgi:signal transduction histidine kinase
MSIVGPHVQSQTASRHKCLIYEGHPSEQLPVVVPLLAESLKDNWRCLYLGDPDCVAMVGNALTQKGVKTAREMDRGALVMSSERGHLDGGKFEPQAMIDSLVAMIDEAVRDGYQGLCATGDMMWELGTEKNFEYLTEYEALLEQVFHRKPLQGICQYRKDVLPARAVRDALMTHPNVYIGQNYTPDNVYFLPPEFLLQSGDTEGRDSQGQWMCEQILRTMKAEQKRDQVMSNLSRSEARLRALADELAQVNQDLELRVKERTAALEATNRELQEFSYAVSHDLRAPLRAIDSLNQFLTEDFADRLGEEGMDHVTRVRERVRLMNDQIDAMLGLARLSQAELRRDDLNLTEIAILVADGLKKSNPDRHVEVSIQPGLTALGDRALLYAVIENLMGNAWKFTAKKEEARIEVGLAEPQEGMTVFFVKDNGAGFDMRYVGKLFTAFQRLHSPKEFSGHGIGLATVQRIVQRHGGSVWASGVEGEGATFFVTLPNGAAAVG